MITVHGDELLERTLAAMGATVTGSGARSASTTAANALLESIRTAADTAQERAASAGLRALVGQTQGVELLEEALAPVSGGATFRELFYGVERGSSRFAQFPAPSAIGHLVGPVVAEPDGVLEAAFDELADELAKVWNRGARST